MVRKTVLLTGATGYVGRYTLRELVRRKYRVRCLVRGDASLCTRSPLIEVKAGDLLDRGPLDGAVSGADSVIHLAAAVRVKDPKANYDSNFVGTKNLVESCKKMEVKRFVYMSTVSAIRKEKGPYGTTKRMGERVVIRSGLDYTVFRPPMIYGPEGQGINNVIRYIKAFPLFIPMVGSGEYTRQPVSVQDVARVTVDSLENVKTFGKVYPLAGADVIKFRDLVRMMAGKMGVRKVILPIPLTLCNLVAAFFEKTTREPLFTREHIRSLSEDTRMDITGLRKDTGFTPVKLEEGIEKLLREMEKS